jgi:hypothetical protein
LKKDKVAGTRTAYALIRDPLHPFEHGHTHAHVADVAAVSGSFDSDVALSAYHQIDPRTISGHPSWAPPLSSRQVGSITHVASINHFLALPLLPNTHSVFLHSLPYQAAAQRQRFEYGVSLITDVHSASLSRSCAHVCVLHMLRSADVLFTCNRRTELLFHLGHTYAHANAHAAASLAHYRPADAAVVARSRFNYSYAERLVVCDRPPSSLSPTLGDDVDPAHLGLSLVRQLTVLKIDEYVFDAPETRAVDRRAASLVSTHGNKPFNAPPDEGVRNLADAVWRGTRH